MHKKKYKAIIPNKVKDINAVNSLLIKLRYYWEMVEVHKRHNEKPDEKKYLEFLSDEFNQLDCLKNRIFYLNHTDKCLMLIVTNDFLWLMFLKKAAMKI